MTLRSTTRISIHRPLSFLTPLLAGLLLAACPSGPGSTDGGDGDTDGGDGDGDTLDWNPAFSIADAGSLSGVWGSGESDIFVFGGNEDTGTVVHYDGTDWSLMTLPADVSLLVWGFGFGPNDVFAVGLDGTAVHYDGATWTKLDTGTTEELWGVWGFANNDLWVVGGNVNGGDPLLLHYDGSTFTPYALPAEQNPRNALSIFKVWGIGSTLFAVGQNGTILGYDGTDWIRHPAGANADDDFVSLWGTSEDHIVAVGGRSNARIATWDGSAWDTAAPTGVAGLNAVFMDDDGTTWVGGVFGLAGRWDADAGDVIYESTDTRIDIHAMWGNGQGLTYAVGGTFFAPHRGVALTNQ